VNNSLDKRRGYSQGECLNVQTFSGLPECSDMTFRAEGGRGIGGIAFPGPWIFWGIVGRSGQPVTWHPQPRRSEAKRPAASPQI